MKDLTFALSAIDKRYITHYCTAIWGNAICVMERKGVAFCRISWYKDDPETVYIDSLSVNKDMRKRGIARHILTMLETIGRRLGAKQSRLCVIPNSWVYYWYKRCGYVEYSNDEQFVYMQKSIKGTNND